MKYNVLNEFHKHLHYLITLKIPYTTTLLKCGCSVNEFNYIKRHQLNSFVLKSSLLIYYSHHLIEWGPKFSHHFQLLSKNTNISPSWHPLELFFWLWNRANISLCAHVLCTQKKLDSERREAITQSFHVIKDFASQLVAGYFQSLYLITVSKPKWLNSFLNQHAEDIVWKNQAKSERTRAEVFTEENRSGWFATLKDVLMKRNLLDKPNQTFNAHESKFSERKDKWI